MELVMGMLKNYAIFRCWYSEFIFVLFALICAMLRLMRKQNRFIRYDLQIIMIKKNKNEGSIIKFMGTTREKIKVTIHFRPRQFLIGYCEQFNY